MFEEFLKFVRKGFDWRDKPREPEHRFFRVDGEYCCVKYRHVYGDADRLVRNKYMELHAKFPYDADMVSGQWTVPGPIENHLTRMATLKEA